jgi:hypothetical protein
LFESPSDRSNSNKSHDGLSLVFILFQSRSGAKGFPDQVQGDEQLWASLIGPERRDRPIE